MALEVSETGRRERETEDDEKVEEDGVEPHGLEKPQITGGLIAGKQISIVIEPGINLEI